MFFDDDIDEELNNEDTEDTEDAESTSEKYYDEESADDGDGGSGGMSPVVSGIILGTIAFLIIGFIVLTVILMHNKSGNEEDKNVTIVEKSTDESNASGSSSETDSETDSKEDPYYESKETSTVRSTGDESAADTTVDDETDETSESENSRYVPGFLYGSDYPDVEKLIKNYYGYLNDKNVEGLKELMYSPEGDLTDDDILGSKDIVESYQNTEVYIIKGIEQFTFIVYAAYDIKFFGIDTPAPALSRFYVCREGGRYRIFRGELSASQFSFLKATENQNNVKQLVELIDEELKAAKKKDGKLSFFLGITS
jgi:hypothetical protein